MDVFGSMVNAHDELRERVDKNDLLLKNNIKENVRNTRSFSHDNSPTFKKGALTPSSGLKRS